MNAKENEFTRVIENSDQVEQLQQAVVEHGREWMAAADDWIRHNPYLAMGIALAVGCAIAAVLRDGD